MIPPTDELKGFVLLENPSRSAVILSVGNTMLINRAGLEAIGNPKFVNIFFDECGMRMMVKKANPKDENVFRVAKSGLSDQSVIKRRILEITNKEEFPERTVVSYLGHKVKSSDSLIFDLSRVHMERKFPRRGV